MNYIANKNFKNWILAIFTAIGAYGGFPKAPEWWIKISQYSIFQFFILWVLVYQGGGQEQILWSLIIALVVYTLMNTDRIISYIKDLFTKKSINRLFDKSKSTNRNQN